MTGATQTRPYTLSTFPHLTFWHLGQRERLSRKVSGYSESHGLDSEAFSGSAERLPKCSKISQVRTRRIYLDLLLMSELMLHSQCLPILCLQISLSNIVKFRKKNWRFDIVGGLVYFILVFSLFPQCKIDTVTQQVWPALPSIRLIADRGGSFLGFRTKLADLPSSCYVVKTANYSL
jgi:hypothetical protein